MRINVYYLNLTLSKRIIIYETINNFKPEKYNKIATLLSTNYRMSLSFWLDLIFRN